MIFNVFLIDEKLAGCFSKLDYIIRRQKVIKMRNLLFQRKVYLCEPNKQPSIKIITSKLVLEGSPLSEVAKILANVEREYSG